MAKFPELYTTGYQYVDPLKVALRSGKTLTSQIEGGQKIRKQKQLYPERDITIKYRAIINDTATAPYLRAFWQFHIDRGGSYETFSFFYPYSNTYVNEYVGIGHGTKIFDLPARDSTSYTLKVNGTTKSPGIEYNFSGQAGADGEDRIGFVVAPASGEVITWSFTGNLKIRCNFKEDNLSMEDFYNALITTGIELEGTKNDG